MSDNPERPAGLINSASELPNDDGVVSKPKPAKQIPDDIGAYRWLRPDPIYCDYFSAQSFADGSIISIPAPTAQPAIVARLAQRISP